MSQSPKAKRRKTTQVGEQKEDKQRWNFYVKVQKNNALPWIQELNCLNKNRGYRFDLDLSQSNASFSTVKTDKATQITK